MDAVQLRSRAILPCLLDEIQSFGRRLQALVVAAASHQSTREEAQRLRSPQSRPGRLVRRDPAPQFVGPVLDLTLLDARPASNDAGERHPHG